MQPPARENRSTRQVGRHCVRLIRGNGALGDERVERDTDPRCLPGIPVDLVSAWCGCCRRFLGDGYPRPQDRGSEKKTQEGRDSADRGNRPPGKPLVGLHVNSFRLPIEKACRVNLGESPTMP